MTTRRLTGLLPLRHPGYRHGARVPHRVATRYHCRDGPRRRQRDRHRRGGRHRPGDRRAPRGRGRACRRRRRRRARGRGDRRADRRRRARVVRTDMLVPADVEALIESAGSLRVLVNNAGGWLGSPHFPDATPAQWGATLDLNLRSAMLATQLALEPMRRAGGGAIVNVASTAGVDEAAYASPEYGAAKAGLIRFTTALRERDGVRVTCVVPDWMRTERAEAELAAMTPQERAAAPEPLPLEVLTDAVVALIRDETSGGRVVVLRHDG